MEVPRNRLNSWKEIAAHLRRDVRTVRRWEHGRGMPVHRVPGGGNASVFAYTDELDAWLLGERSKPDFSEPDPPANGSPDRIDNVPIADRIDDVPPSADHPAGNKQPTGRNRVVLLFSIAAIAVAAILLYVLLQPHALPVHRLVVVNSTIRALDENANVLWEFKDLPVQDPAPAHTSYIGPRDATGDQMLVYQVDVRDPDHHVSAALLAFHGNGRLRWRVSLHDRLRFPSGEYGPSWTSQGSDITTYELNGHRYFAWAMHHETWWPSIVVVVDGDGNVRGKFVNSGWITKLFASPDARFLMASGVSNSAMSSVTAVLDTRNPSGTSPEPDNSPHTCLNCPEGRPVSYIVFDDSAVRRATGFILRYPTVKLVDKDLFEIRVPEAPANPTAPETIYEFTSDFKLLRATRTDDYRDLRRRLNYTGHSSSIEAAYAEDDAPTVRMWTAKGGWVVQGGQHPAAAIGK